MLWNGIYRGMAIRYAHTNLIARDWRRLATFYQDVFACVPVPPERDLSGAGLLTFQYMADPEGNIIEIQNWRNMDS